jgi:prevent-host-death family protein
MTELNIHEAKTHLSKYLQRVQEGETVIICKNGTPIAQLAPLPKKDRPKRQVFGAAKDKIIKIDDSFFDPLTDEEFPGCGL